MTIQRTKGSTCASIFWFLIYFLLVFVVVVLLFFCVVFVLFLFTFIKPHWTHQSGKEQRNKVQRRHEWFDSYFTVFYFDRKYEEEEEEEILCFTSSQPLRLYQEEEEEILSFTPSQLLRLYQGEEEERTFVAPHQKVLRIKGVVWGKDGDDILE